MESLQSHIALNPETSGLELLNIVQPELAAHYLQGLKQYQNNRNPYSQVMARYGTAATQSLGLFGELSLEAVKSIWQGRAYTADAVLKQIEQWETNRRTEVYNGLVHSDNSLQTKAQAAWQQLPNRQRALLFNDFADWLRKNPATNILLQQAILTALPNTTFQTLDLSAFHASLEDKLLTPILEKSSGSLTELNLNGCQNLSDVIPGVIADKCPNLKILNISNMAWKSFSTEPLGCSLIVLPKIEKLEMKNCQALECFITEAPKADINLEDCTALKHVQFNPDLSLVAAKQPEPGAFQYELAKAYLLGTGVLKNLSQAYYWARLSLAHKHQFSAILCYALFNFHAVTPINGNDESLAVEKATVLLVGESVFTSIQALKHTDLKTLKLNKLKDINTPARHTLLRLVLAENCVLQDLGLNGNSTITGVFGVPLKLEGQYINLQILCTDLKTKKTEEGKESKELAETKRDEKYKDARMASVEDLFGDKRAVKAENLFKPTRELFDDKELETVKDVNESPRLLLVQGRAGIGKTTFVHYVAHQWSKGQLYANYTWVFTLTLRKLRLLPNTSALSLAEWIWQSQFSSWSPEEFTAAEFKALWRERIEPAIKQNQVLLILDGYDEVPERHPCGAILDGLLHLRGIYENLSLLVTSRPFNVKGITERRRNLEIIGFTDENISQYIQTYFLETHDKTLANILIETLRKQPIIWANSHIPLNLNLLCGIMEDIIKETNTQGLNQALMQLSSMTRLYQMMEKKLYERFFVKHDIDSPSEERELMVESNDFIEDYEEQRLFLGELAFQSFEIGEIIISREIVRTALRAYVNKVAKQDTEKNNPKEKITLGETFFKTVRRLGLIKPILDKSGLSKTKQDYEFLHLTFHEYYVAIYLAKGFNGVDPTSKAEAEKVISKEKYNPRWQIVWWFVAGLLRENTPIYKAYLQQLQDQCSGQTLTQDILQHYQLGLSVRCVDEGFQPNNQRVIEPIVTQLQLSFLKLYQTAKNVTNNDCDALKKLAFINSPFFSACRISPNLCMSERQDLYALIW
jgi:hypothetical protein